MMTLNNLAKIYYINLNKDNIKYNYFIKTIKKSILFDRCERFIGVDGSTIDLRILSDDIITDKARSDIMSDTQKIYGISLTYGSLGCALSHRLIFEECAKLQSNKPVLILEDDIVLSNNFDTSFISVLDKLDKIEYDICYLGYNEIPGFKKNKIDNVLAKPSGLITGLYGYLLKPSGASKLLDYIFPLNVQIDSSISHHIDKLNAYCSYNKLIDVNNQFCSKTQQNNSCKNIHRDHKFDSWNLLFGE